MPRKQQPNVTPEFIGEYYVDGENKILKLMRCETEPLALFERASGEQVSGKISEFANLVRLKRTREIPKAPEPRKVRVDKGTKHTKKEPLFSERNAGTMGIPPLGELRAVVSQEGDQAIGNLLGEDEVVIQTSTEEIPEYTVKILCGYGKATTLRLAVEEALKEFDGRIPDTLSAKSKALIQSILRPRIE